MEWYIVSICLGFTYSAYVLLSHFLMDLYNLKPQTVFVNVLCIAALISLCVYPQELRMPKLNTQYALFFLIGLSIFFQNLFTQIGTKIWELLMDWPLPCIYHLSHLCCIFALEKL